MLPFLSKKPQVAGIMTVERKPDEGKEPEQDQSGIEAAAGDLIAAIHSKDVRAVAAAIKAAFEIMDSEPHEEGPHLNESEQE